MLYISVGIPIKPILKDTKIDLYQIDISELKCIVKTKKYFTIDFNENVFILLYKKHNILVQNISFKESIIFKPKDTIFIIQTLSFLKFENFELNLDQIEFSFYKMKFTKKK